MGCGPLHSVFEISVLNGTAPQVASETERRCLEIRCSGPGTRRSAFYSLGCRFHNGAQAFTLVEVVIAVGLVAFVLTAILGLAVLASNETKNADLKARLAWITGRVTSEYQSQEFSLVLQSLASSSATNYWDYSGLPVTNAADAYFVSEISNVTPATASTNHLALLQVSTRWPNPQLTSTNVCVISLFNYQ